MFGVSAADSLSAQTNFSRHSLARLRVGRNLFTLASLRCIEKTPLLSSVRQTSACHGFCTCYTYTFLWPHATLCILPDSRSTLKVDSTYTVSSCSEFVLKKGNQKLASECHKAWGCGRSLQQSPYSHSCLLSPVTPRCDGTKPTKNTRLPLISTRTQTPPMRHSFTRPPSHAASFVLSHIPQRRPLRIRSAWPTGARVLAQDGADGLGFGHERDKKELPLWHPSKFRK